MKIKNSTSFNLSEYYSKWLIEPINVGIYDLCCSLPGLLVNFIFIIAVCRNKDLRKVLFLLVYLSTANLIISLYILFLGLSELITSDKEYLLKPYECFYQQPHLTFSIIGMQSQACASILVAAERTIAVRLPYRYLKMQKTKLIKSSIVASLAFVAVTYGIAVGLSFQVYQSHGMIKHDRCYPSLVSGVEYGSFLYAFPAASGMVAILCYLVILCFELKNIFKVRSNDSNFAKRNKHQFWLVKISCILAFSAFLFVVVPYTLLLVGRWRRAGDDDTSYYDEFTSYLRRFVTFALSSNSFFGVTFCFFASTELRNEVKSTLMCRNLQKKEVTASLKIIDSNAVDTKKSDNQNI